MYQKIVSLAPSNTEIIYALGAQDKLVACTRYCDFPEEAKKKPRIGGWLDINDKLVKSYNPDLILTSTFVQDKITLRYKKSKMNIVALMPTTLNGVFDSIIKIGKLVEKENEANELVYSMKNKFYEIENKAKNYKKQKSIKNKSKIIKPKIYIEEWHKPPTVSGNWVPDLVKIAGGKYDLIKSGVHSKEITTEQIQKYNPEIIIISICGMADKVPKEWITKRKGWGNLNAIKNNKIFVFDDSLLNRPGPRLATGAENLVEVIRDWIYN
ncbi:MAG TPA: cobalamin-binding protein [Candidatus Nanoarchaeia archaeon]|nr:cobalamin-binding protein [Candidatus Nanoarchaeia archaeon]